MNTPKTVAWLATVIAILALAYAGWQQKRANARGEQIAALTFERDTLRETLRQKQQAAPASRNSSLRTLAAPTPSTPAAPVPVAAPEPAPAPMSQQPTAVPRLPPQTEDTERAHAAERMAALKPQLQAGLPIRGAIVTHVNGIPTAKPVEFVVGRETVVSGVDDGTYVITPTLNEDGSVRYNLSLLKKDPAGGQDVRQTLPAVTTAPWSGFTLGALAFDPDAP